MANTSLVFTSLEFLSNCGFQALASCKKKFNHWFATSIAFEEGLFSIMSNGLLVEQEPTSKFGASVPVDDQADQDLNTIALYLRVGFDFTLVAAERMMRAPAPSEANGMRL